MVEGGLLGRVDHGKEDGAITLAAFSGSDLLDLPAKSRFYEQVTGVKWFLSFSFIESLPLLLSVAVVPCCCLSTLFLFAL